MTTTTWRDSKVSTVGEGGGNDATILHIILFIYSLELKIEGYLREGVCGMVWCMFRLVGWLVGWLVGLAWLLFPVCYFLTPLSLSYFVSLHSFIYSFPLPPSALYLFFLGLCFVGLFCLVRCGSCSNEIDIIAAPTHHDPSLAP